MTHILIQQMTNDVIKVFNDCSIEELIVYYKLLCKYNQNLKKEQQTLKNNKQLQQIKY